MSDEERATKADVDWPQLKEQLERQGQLERLKELSRRAEELLEQSRSRLLVGTENE
jgi:hypothetical protein